MSIRLNEAGKTLITLLLATLLSLIWAAKRLILIGFIAGLALPLVPKETSEAFLHLPLIGRASSFFLWLMEHGLHLCLMLSLLMIFSLLKKIDRLQMYQDKQAYILGGLVNYLEISDFRFSYAIEEAKKSGVSFDKLLSQWWRNFFARFVGGKEGGEFIAGTDPFDTVFKRGDKTVTLKEDIKKYRQEKVF